MPISAYEVTLEIDGEESVIQLDDTYPAVNDWVTATEFAMLMARHFHPDAVNIEMISCGEYVPDDLQDIDYVYDTPLRIN